MNGHGTVQAAINALAARPLQTTGGHTSTVEALASAGCVNANSLIDVPNTGASVDQRRPVNQTHAAVAR